MTHCHLCGSEIVSVGVGPAYPDMKVWIDIIPGKDPPVTFESTVRVLHMANCSQIMERVRKCDHCSRRIAWLKTVNGKKMPVVASTWEGSPIYDRSIHFTHFGDCPKSKELSRHGR